MERTPIDVGIWIEYPPQVPQPRQSQRVRVPPQVIGSVGTTAVAARTATSVAVSKSLVVVTNRAIGKSSYALAGAAAYGMLANDAFALGDAVTTDDLAIALASGVICRR